MDYWLSLFVTFLDFEEKRKTIQKHSVGCVFEKYIKKNIGSWGERLLKTSTLIGQEIQLSSSCPITARELYLWANQSMSL